MLPFLCGHRISPQNNVHIPDSLAIPRDAPTNRVASDVLHTVRMDKAPSKFPFTKWLKLPAAHRRSGGDQWRRENLTNQTQTSEEEVFIRDEIYQYEIAALRRKLKRSRRSTRKLRDQAIASNKRASDADDKIVVQSVVGQLNLLLACEEHEVESKVTRNVIDSLTVELRKLDRKCIVALIASERLQSQLDNERLELKARTAAVETEILRSICSNIAHDLKTPLYTIMMVLDSLRGSGIDFDVRNRELLDTLDSATAFMSSAIGRTIDFTKSSSSINLIPTPATFNLVESLMCPVQWMNSMLPVDSNTAISLEHVPSVLSTVVTDKKWLEDNLLCLLSNAIKFSTEGSARVLVTLEDERKMIRITVEDNGTGIPEELKSKIFKQAFQGERQSVGGSGLGLFCLSKRSEAIGGSCGVNNRADGQQGSSFWFEFPYQPGACVNVQLIRPLEALTKPRKSLRILLVDDCLSVVKVLSKKLETYGHHVVTAKNGAEGLNKMVNMNSDLDLVIMDVQMPVMDGIEATRLYREMEGKEGLTHFPIICSSANADSDTRQRAIAAGVDTFLSKPFDMESFLNVLNEI